MKSTQIVSFLIGCAAALTVQVRDRATIQANFVTTDDRLRNVTRYAEAYTGGAGNFTTIFFPERDYERALNATADELATEGQLSASDCASLASYYGNPLRPDVARYVKAFVDKKTQSKAAGGRPLVNRYFGVNRFRYAQITEALASRCPAQQAATIRSIGSDIDQSIATGNATYNSP